MRLARLMRLLRLLRRRSTGASASLVGIVSLVGVSLAGSGSLGCHKTPVDVPVAWEPEVDVGIARARREGKPIVIYFGATWDTAAKELEYVTFADPEVRFLLRRDFVAVHVDTTDDEDPVEQRTVRRFDVIGDPTILILGPQASTELVRVTEFVQPARFASMLRRAVLPDAVREARFESAARARADEARR
jgi:thiol:disulfide interchange protein